MKRALAICFGALALAACGGGNQPAANTPAPFISRLSTFAADEMLAGLTLPDATAYWSMAEARNGNTFPVKAKRDQPELLIARVLPGAEIALWDGKAFSAAGISGLRARLQPMAEATFNADLQASSCALIVLAHVESSWSTLLELELACVELRVGNLWLGTHDKRGEVTRLLPLKVDTSQVVAEGYELAPETAAGTVLLHWVKANPILRMPDGALRRAGSAAGWGKGFAADIASAKPRPRRVQLSLPPTATLRPFEKALYELSGAALAEIEPYWPVLKTPPVEEPPREARRLARFDDERGMAARVEPPTMSEYWRVAEQSDRLPLPVRPAAAATQVLLCVDQDSRWSSLAPGQADWAEHADMAEVTEVLVANAGEVEPGAKPSALLVLLAIDRRAPWQCLLELYAAMARVGVRRLHVLVQDQLGPTPRLLDLSLPAAELSQDAARLELGRQGQPEDGQYTARLFIAESEFNAEGPRFLAALARHVGQGAGPVETLAIRLPADEPAATFFQLANALARLYPKRLRLLA